MGRIWGTGGLIGPGSRLESWTSQRLWRLFFVFAVSGSIVWFPGHYFGLVSDRSKHQVVPSLVRAVIYGIFLGLIMLFADWMGLGGVGRRNTERDGQADRDGQ
jgi:hypothetical protein